MTLQEIQTAVRSGQKVHWANDNYEVIEGSKNQWLIHSKCNDHYWGLTHTDNTTINGKPEDFYIG
jgi:hypothetical protein